MTPKLLGELSDFTDVLLETTWSRDCDLGDGKGAFITKVDFCRDFSGFFFVSRDPDVMEDEETRDVMREVAKAMKLKNQDLLFCDQEVT